MYKPSSRRLDDIRSRLSTIDDPIALLEGIFAYSPVGFQIYRADGRCVLVNDAFRALFGAEPPPDYNILRDEIAEENGVLDLIRRAFAGETIATPPIWYDPRELKQVRVVEGRRCAMTSTFFPLHGPDGQVSYVAIVFEDVTEERLLAEVGEALASSLDEQQTLLTIARLAVPAFADFCLVDLVEDEGLRRVAAAHADSKGQADLEEIARRPLLRAAFEKLAADAIRADHAILAQYPDDGFAAGEAGRRAFVRQLGVASQLAVPLRGRTRVLGALTFCRTSAGRRYDSRDARFAEELASRAALAIENARLFQEVTAAQRQAEAASRAKDRFLAMVGHELRNPLAPIATALHLMRLRAGGPTERERVVIERQVRHLERLVNDLLDISRVTQGKVELKRRRVEIAEVIGDAIEMVSPLLEDRGHHLRVRVPRRGLVVDGDPERLAQVAANLLSNACKYTDHGGRISVEAAARGGRIVIEVSDDGVGISPEFLPRIFDSFIQGRQSIARAQGGLGLGLAIVKSLVELHGGRVCAHSDGTGRGSTFVIELLAAEEATSEADLQRLPVELPSQPAVERRVLIVDDNRDAADVLAETLVALGYTTRVAHDGPTALEVAAEFKPEIALLDIGLPIMDGYEVARLLRADEALRPIKIIAVTGYGEEEARRRSADAGFDAHLVKPVAVDTLAGALSATDSSLEH